MSTDDDTKLFPKSMRHRQILDAAEENPDASVDELASMVPSATTELVERVFEQYGDPANEDTETATANEMSSPTDSPTDNDDDGTGETDDVNPGDETDTEDEGYPAPDDLSEKQRKVLAHVAADPDATQQEIGERLGVSSPTVSNRVNSIEGFEWSNRAALVDDVFDEPPDVSSTANAENADTSSASESTESTESSESTGSTESSELTEPSETVPNETMTELETSIERLERRVAELEAGSDRDTTGNSAFDDPELVHKVVHACMESDAISESEELRILKGLLE